MTVRVPYTESDILMCYCYIILVLLPHSPRYILQVTAEESW
jgi:hypothetical protein